MQGLACFLDAWSSCAVLLPCHFLDIKVTNNDGIGAGIFHDLLGYIMLEIAHLIGKLSLLFLELVIVEMPFLAELLATIPFRLHVLVLRFPVQIGTLVLDLDKLTVQVNSGDDVRDAKIDGLIKPVIHVLGLVDLDLDASEISSILLPNNFNLLDQRVLVNSIGQQREIKCQLHARWMLVRKR